MGHRELCICCFQLITKAQLRKHAAEAARRERVIAMGGDPDVPEVSPRFRMKPITGNDTFPPQPSAPTPASSVDDRTFYSEPSAGSPPSTVSSPHYIEDGCRDLPTPMEQTVFFQEGHQYDTRAFAVLAEGRSGLTPLSPSRNTEQQSTVTLHRDSPQGVQISETRPVSPPPLQIFYQRVGSAPDRSDNVSYPQEVPQEQQYWPTPPNNNVAALDPEEFQCIPRPRALSQKNLRTEMQLDRTAEAKAYYNKIRHVIRGHMSEWFWMDWSNVPDDQKKTLFDKVFNDPRIPIIKRYKDHWATDQIAKTIASARRTAAYSRKEAIPNPKYAHNAANLTKRNPKAPRGRWDSVSQSIGGKVKGKKAQRVEVPERNVSAAPLKPLDKSEADVRPSNTHSLAYGTPGGPQDHDWNETADPFVYVSFTLDDDRR